MLTSEQEAQINGPLRITQIIAIALMTGVVMITGVLSFVAAQQPAPAENQPLNILPVLAAGLGLLNVVLSFIVPGVAINQQRQNVTEPTVGAFALLFQTKTIIALAMVEAMALFNAVALLVAKTWWSLGVIAGLLAMMAIFHFPTRGRMAAFVETELFNHPSEGH